MKEHFTKFTCDNKNCRKKGRKVARTEEEGFPYELGWQYIYRLDAKTFDKRTFVGSKDKHYCSMECAMIGIRDSLNEAAAFRKREQEARNKAREATEKDYEALAQ